jgi:hypothetical protein
MTAPAATVLEHEIGPTGLVAIRLHASDIRIRAVDGSVVRVNDTTGTLARSVRIERGPGSLSLQADRGLSLSLGSLGSIGLGVGRRVPNLEIEVPRQATLVVETASGGITVDGLAGDQRYRTASGQVRLRDVCGSLTLDVVSGDVDILSVGSCTLEARSVSGDLAVRGDMIGFVRLSTTSGDLRINGRLAGPGPSAIETVSGDTTLAPTGSLRVEVISVAGDVRSDIEATTESGRGSTTVVVGEDGPTLTIRSISGNVRLVRGSLPVSLPSQRPPESTLPRMPVMLDVATEGRTVATSDPAELPDKGSMAILESLERGEIDVDEAARRLEILDSTHVPAESEPEPEADPHPHTDADAEMEARS